MTYTGFATIIKEFEYSDTDIIEYLDIEDEPEKFHELTLDELREIVRDMISNEEFDIEEIIVDF